MMPPKHVPAPALWAEMTATPRPHRVVPFPRKGADGQPIGEVAIRTLLQSEQIRAGLNAEKLVRAVLPNAKDGESIGYSTAYTNAVAVEQLFLACRDATDLDCAAFPSPKAMREHLTTDEIAVLYEQYLTVTAEIGPIIGAFTKAEQDAWIDRLIAGAEGSGDALAFFSSAALRSLLLSSVARLRSSRTPPSSVGSPLESTGDEPTDTLDAPAPDEGL